MRSLSGNRQFHRRVTLFCMPSGRSHSRAPFFFIPPRLRPGLEINHFPAPGFHPLQEGLPKLLEVLVPAGEVSRRKHWDIQPSVFSYLVIPALLPTICPKFRLTQTSYLSRRDKYFHVDHFKQPYHRCLGVNAPRRCRDGNHRAGQSRTAKIR